MSIRFGRSGNTAGVAAVAIAALVLSPVLAGCGKDRPPKPACPIGQEAQWDDGDKRWECVDDDDNGSHSGDSGKSRRR